MSTKYSKEFKDSIIVRMLPPHKERVPDLARETEFPKDSLYTWWFKYRNIQGVSENHNGSATQFSSEENWFFSVSCG
jgi:transposase-like protein